MTYNVIATGSKGNAVLINDQILIDCGVPYKKLEPYTKTMRLVLLTHIHSDHFNPATVRALHRERPALRWGCCEWMVEPLLEAGVDKRVIDVISPYSGADGAALYKRLAAVHPEFIPHDVPNCAWHIFDGKEHLLYATDTGTLDGIEAKHYNLYLIEANHTRAEIEERIAAKVEAGEFAYEYRAARNHLSQEQALDWLAENAGQYSRYVFLHQHQEAGCGDALQ